MHFHIHVLIHYLRHARLLGGYLRYLGTLLLVLLSGLFQFVIAEPAPALLTAKANDGSAAGLFYHTSTANADGECRMVPVPSAALEDDTYRNVFSRLKSGIVMVPRMNRTPKPKSVYRIFARAPGSEHCREARHLSSRTERSIL